QLTLEEVQAGYPEVTQEQFDQVDRNLDGVLSVADLPDSPIPPDDVARLELLRAIIRADLNHDGVLDFTEIAAAFPDAPAELLTRIDTDHNWLITRAEVRAALQQAYNGGLLVPLEDVNASGDIDAGDVQLVINHALKRYGQFVLADISGDNNVNATDVQQVINGVLQSK
ncbi:MAG: dockerin type I domain-containing protein, partial [FCB group bacterium]|nr:dockerin type I domain-containing protein [FCB group bacterium]